MTSPDDKTREAMRELEQDGGSLPRYRSVADLMVDLSAPSGAPATTLTPERLAEIRSLLGAWVWLDGEESARLLAGATTDLLSEREQMLAVLREVEWAATGRTDGRRACPACCGADPLSMPRATACGSPAQLLAAADRLDQALAAEPGGHVDGCRLAALLRE